MFTTNPVSQADSKFQTLFAYTWIMAKVVRQALIDERSYVDADLPCENTIGNILNRLDYRYRLSIDTKSKLSIEDFSRHGKTCVANPDPALLSFYFLARPGFVPQAMSRLQPGGSSIFFAL